MYANHPRKTIALILLMSVAVIPSAKAAQSHPDYEAITATAYDYAFGIANHDVARLERAFAMDKAQLKLVLDQNGELTVYVIPIRDLMEKIWLKLPLNPDLFVEVMNINIIEGKYATIVINNNNEFVDQLSLYRINGEWKIVDKIAIRHPDAPPASADLVKIFGDQSGQRIGLLPQE